MSVLTVLAEEATHAALPLPPLVFGLIALVVFSLMGFVTFSFRDVSHRHETPAASPSDRRND